MFEDFLKLIKVFPQEDPAIRIYWLPVTNVKKTDDQPL